MSNIESTLHSLKTLLHLENVSVYDGDVALLKHIDLDVTEGSFHCLVGESGSGKSLLSRTALQMYQPHLRYEGNVEINLNETDAMFQDANSNFFQNVRIQNISMPYLIRLILNCLASNNVNLCYVNLEI